MDKKGKMNRIRSVAKLVLALLAIVLLFGTPYVAILGDDATGYAGMHANLGTARALVSPSNVDAVVSADFSNYETVQKMIYGMNEKDRWDKFTYDVRNQQYERSLNTSYIRVWIDKAQPNPQPGVWNYTQLDDYVNAVYATGAQPFMGISYAPGHMSKNGVGSELNYPTDRAAFARYCAELVRHYNVEQRRGIVYWEIWNEPWWEPYSMEEYIPLFNDAASAMKAVDPTIKVGGPGNAWYIPEWVDGTLQRCPLLDFIPWHIYNGDRSGTDDGQIMDDTAIYERTALDAKSRIDRYRPNSGIEIMITELNSVSKWNPTTDPRISFQFNAPWYASALNHLIRGGMDKEFYFEGTCADDPYHNFGMWSETGALKPAYWTKRMYSQYAPYGSTIVNSTSTNNKVEALAVANGTSNLFLINKENASKRVGVQLTGIENSATFATMYTLSEASFRANNWNALEQRHVTVLNGTATVDLPAYGVAVIVVNGTPDVLHVKASEFAIKPVGNAYANGAWRMTNNGSISNFANYGKGYHNITVNASNASVNGPAPHMVVSVNGSPIGEANVSGGFENYTYGANLTGSDTIEVAFDNDQYAQGLVDVDLLVDSVTVEEATYVNHSEEVNAENATGNSTFGSATPDNSTVEGNPTNASEANEPGGNATNGGNATENNTTDEGTGLSFIVPVFKVAEPVSTPNGTYMRPSTVTASNLTNLDLANGSIEIGFSEVELTKKGTIEKRVVTRSIPQMTLDSWNRDPGLMAIAFEFAVYYTCALSTAVLLIARRNRQFAIF